MQVPTQDEAQASLGLFVCRMEQGYQTGEPVREKGWDADKQKPICSGEWIRRRPGAIRDTVPTSMSMMSIRRFGGKVLLQTLRLFWTRQRQREDGAWTRAQDEQTGVSEQGGPPRETRKGTERGSGQGQTGKSKRREIGNGRKCDGAAGFRWWVLVFALATPTHAGGRG